MEKEIKEIIHLLPKSELIKRQAHKIDFFPEINKEPYILKVNLRYDDDCGNGSNSFSITGEFGHYSEPRNNRSFGCIHEIISEHAPEYKKYIKWHLTTSNGPMYYLSNTLYHAGDRDCWGKRKGAPKDFELRLFVNKSPLPYTKYSTKFLQWIQENCKQGNLLTIKEIAHVNKNGETYKFDPKFSFNDFAAEWYQCPFDSLPEAESFLKAVTTCEIEIKSVCTGWGEGKEPDLNAARSCAVWPDAQLEDFTKEKLLARLPGLMQEFKRDMEELGFVY